MKRKYNLKLSKLLILLVFLQGCVVSVNPQQKVTCSIWDVNEKCGATADCAALLYNKARAVMSESEQHAKHRLYLAARVSYYHALCLLNEAKARLNYAKTKDFDDWKTAQVFGLGNNIQESIHECNKYIDRYRWLN